jgi:hypothetical protein
VVLAASSFIACNIKILADFDRNGDVLIVVELGRKKVEHLSAEMIRVIAAKEPVEHLSHGLPREAISIAYAWPTLCLLGLA